MKMFFAAGALLISQSTWAAPLKVTSLECTALNAVGYASLRLEKPDVVSIVINSVLSSKAQIKSVTENAILLDAPQEANQYRLEFPEPLKAGEQSVSGGLYAKYSQRGPFYLVSYASCNLKLQEVAP